MAIGKECYPDFRHQVALGLVPGFTAFRKFGRNDDVDGNEEMWELGTARVLPTSAAVVSVTSSSAEDDPDEATPPGTGAWTLTIQGLDANYDEISETITLNGTSAATTTASFLRVNRAFVVTAGTNGTNLGNLTGTIGGAAQFYIEANEGQTHQTHYTVPNGKVLLITGLSIMAGTLGNSHMVVETQSKLFATDAAWRSTFAIDLTDGEHYYSNSNKVGEYIPAKTEIRQKLIFSGTNGEVSGEIHGFLVDSDLVSRM